MDRQQAVKDIADKISRAETLIMECEMLSDEFDIEFEFCPAYGMGRTYQPKATHYHEQGWNPSSESC
jgi:hypothetical protein